MEFDSMWHTSDRAMCGPKKMKTWPFCFTCRVNDAKPVLRSAEATELTGA